MREPSTYSNWVIYATRQAHDAWSATHSVFTLFLGSNHRRSDREEGDKDGRQEAEAVVIDAYRSMRASNPVRSGRVLADWLRSRGDQPEDYAWLSSRIKNWEDPRIITRLTEERVARLLALKRAREVLDVVSRRLTVDAYFRPKSAADTLSAAQLAARDGGKPQVARILLSDFATRFEGDPRVTVADTLRRHLSSHASAKRKSA